MRRAQNGTFYDERLGNLNYEILEPTVMNALCSVLLSDIVETRLLLWKGLAPDDRMEVIEMLVDHL
jgi:hypothetical protein